MNLKIEKIGREQQPVIVLDNATAGADALVNIAADERFDFNAPYYPGLRAPAPGDYAQSLLAGFSPLIHDIFALSPASLSITGCEFSLVTKKPAELATIQRLPHYDGTDPNILAVLHFLCDESHGGTDFYRHRATGFETIDDARFARYKNLLEVEVAELGAPAAAYMSGSTSLFEQTARFPARFNRILIYRGVTLHSGYVPEGHSLSRDPRAGRLTVNTFIKGVG